MIWFCQSMNEKDIFYIILWQKSESWAAYLLASGKKKFKMCLYFFLNVLGVTGCSYLTYSKGDADI